MIGTHRFGPSRIYDHRGISRLTLGKAIWGEREKGVHDPEHIAVNIVALYDDRWLARELEKDTAEHMTAAWWIVDRIRELVENRRKPELVPVTATNVENSALETVLGWYSSERAPDMWNRELPRPDREDS